MTEMLIVPTTVPAKAIPVTAATTGRVLLGPGAVVMGWAFRNDSPSQVAAVAIYNGQDTTGTLVVPIGLLASESTRDYLSPAGVLFDSGVYLDVTAGSVTGSVWITPA